MIADSTLTPSTRLRSSTAPNYAKLNISTSNSPQERIRHAAPNNFHYPFRHINVPIFAIAFATLGSVFAQPTSENIFVKTISTISASVLPIVCTIPTIPTDKRQKIGATRGTGIWVSGDGQFITANHVIEDMIRTPPGSEPCQNTAVYMSSGGWRAYKPVFMHFDANECFRDADVDLATCWIQPNVIATLKAMNLSVIPVSFNSIVSPDGEEVAFTGFPVQSKAPFTARGHIAAYDFGRMPPNIWVDHTAWPGSSGSPLYLKDGTIIGIILRKGLEDLQGTAIARLGATVNDFLSRSRERKQK